MNEFSYIVSSNRSKEAPNGMTVDNAIHQLETPNSVCTLIDTPGNLKHRQTATAALGQADVAILVVDSTAADIEECTTTTVPDDSKVRFGYEEIAQIAHDQGIRQMIVVLTKLDDRGAHLTEKQYSNVVKSIGFSLDKIGFRHSPSSTITTTIPFIPLSGLNGDNLTHRSPGIPWYDGPYLMQALDGMEIPVRESFKQLWIPILNVCQVERIGIVAIGTIETGTLEVGMQVKILPNDVLAKVESIEMHHTALSTAQAGDHVGFNLVFSVDDTTTEAMDIRPGCIATDADVSYSTLVDHGYL
ncbi:unnamed protein product [Cylindrotheca closterium]|uniref:Tr-type G domain-containing protein n=1 Tax=Cylindrotheca closterium TaxID=2856 RepID=A0AAD2FAG1_9STRA|nr:unnamed protein product [Cylindrotheca closterium]